MGQGREIREEGGKAKISLSGITSMLCVNIHHTPRTPLMYFFNYALITVIYQSKVTNSVDGYILDQLQQLHLFHIP